MSSGHEEGPVPPPWFPHLPPDSGNHIFLELAQDKNSLVFMALLSAKRAFGGLSLVCQLPCVPGEIVNSNLWK